MATKRTTKTTARYRPHPMLAMEAKARTALAEETGRDWDAWVAFARRKGPRDRAALKRWLQEEHGLQTMRARWIAGGALDPDAPSHDEPEPLVDALYSGVHAGLRPLHEKLVDVMLAQGDDVLVTACKTMVPVFRKHVFADLRPVDGSVQVGLALGDAPAESRLELARHRAPGDRLTHRVRVRSAREIDGELKAWIASAYEKGARALERGPVTTEIPPDVAKALKSSAKAQATWGECTPAMRRDLLEWITSARQDATRSKRVARAIEALAAGRRRVY